jgi:hypothetical protein
MDSREDCKLEGGDSRVSIHLSEVPTISLLGVAEVAATRVWQCVQRVVKDVGEELQGVERAIARTFLPALFDDRYDDESNPWRSLAALPVKHAGLALPNPTTSANSNYEASILVCSHLLAAFRGVEELDGC